MIHSSTRQFSEICEFPLLLKWQISSPTTDISKIVSRLTIEDKKQLVEKIEQFIKNNSSILFSPIHRSVALEGLKKIRFFIGELNLGKEQDLFIKVNRLIEAYNPQSFPLTALPDQFFFNSLVVTDGIFQSKLTHPDQIRHSFSLKMKELGLTGKLAVEFLCCYARKVENLTVNLSDCPDITDEDVIALAMNCPGLTILYLDGNKQITVESMKALALNSFQINFLRLKDTEADDHWCKVLLDFPNLCTLSLSGCEQLTDAGLAYLATSKILTKLELQCCKKISDKGVNHLCVSPLKILNLIDNDQLTDDALANINRFKELKALYLGKCPSITNRGYFNLAMNNLELLNVCCNDEVNDQTLAYFCKITSLRRLNLSGCDNFSNGLDYLRKNDSLEELFLSGCQQMR